MEKFEKYIALLLLFFAIGFNVWIYRLEPTAKIDPNDNTFQYALVDRTNQIWNFAHLRYSLLFDHWVPNWAEGYALPANYSHIPQIAIVASFRLISHITLFAYYHWIIYLLLCLFPVSVFLALRIIKLPWLVAGIGALIASHISTDGLYGLDPASFLWRGYGLSSQLFAMIFLPIAIAYIWRRDVLRSILFLTATTAGHLGIGIIAFIASGIVALKPPLRANLTKLLLVFAGVLLLLGYWIIPAALQNTYHNFSVWDPLWKFNSYGMKEVLTRLFNGDLFDFGRFPVLTALVGLGLFVSVLSPDYFPFVILFIGMLFLYFGRTTWGPLIDLIPEMREFHLSRFIVGVHLAELFLIPIGIEFIFKKIKLPLKIILIIGLVLLVYPQTVKYAAFNDQLIRQANTNYEKAEPDASVLLSTLNELLKTHPGRVYAGRGGGWGRDFRIAETPYYMYLSTYGIPTVLWLPETWSPNSDTEQYFSEDNPAHYALYNIKYVVAPPTQEPQSFWKPLKQTPSWKLYEVATPGYITAGLRPAIVASTKDNYKNVVRLWIQSPYPSQHLYPQLSFDTNSYPKSTGLPNFKMIDEATYQIPDKSLHSLFAEPPFYLSPSPLQPNVLSQSDDTDMVFKATVDVPAGCTECIVVLHETYYPNWKATIDGKSVETFAVFPFFTAVKLETAGMHEVIFSYR